MSNTQRPPLAAPPKRPQFLIRLRSGNQSAPLFCIHGLGGHVAGFVPLARGLETPRAVYALQAQGLEPGPGPHDRIEAMAAAYFAEIRTVQPHGPYLLAGWSLGGVIALETARQAAAMGQTVALVALLDTWLSVDGAEARGLDDQAVMEWLDPHVQIPAAELRQLPLRRRWQRVAEQAQRVEGLMVADIRRLATTCLAHLDAAEQYVIQPYDGRVLLLRPGAGREGLERRWHELFSRLDVEPVAGNHYTMLRKPEVDVLTDRLGRYLHEIAANGEMTKR